MSDMFKYFYCINNSNFNVVRFILFWHIPHDLWDATNYCQFELRSMSRIFFLTYIKWFNKQIIFLYLWKQYEMWILMKLHIQIPVCSTRSAMLHKANSTTSHLCHTGQPTISCYLVYSWTNTKLKYQTNYVLISRTQNCINRSLSTISKNYDVYNYYYNQLFNTPHGKLTNGKKVTILKTETCD